MLKLVDRAIRLMKRKGVQYLIKYVLALFDHRTGLVSFFLVPYIAYKLKRMGLRETLNLLFSDSLIGMLFRPMQVRREIEEFLNILKPIKPRHILEIGTAHGGTLLLWTRVVSDDALIVSIDLPGGSFGGGYPWLRSIAYRAFAKGRQRIVLIRGDSHDYQTLEKINKIFGNSKIDFLFIDGDHSYMGVKKDFEMYSLLVREGGIIVFHDIVPGLRELVGGVPDFWKELKERLARSDSKVIEIVRDWNQGGYGIGVLFKCSSKKVS